MASATKQPKAKTKRRKPTKAEQLSEAESLLKKIEKAADEKAKAKMVLWERKEAYKRQKEVIGEIQERLDKLERARKEKLPLFDKPKAADKEPAGETDTKPEEAQSLFDGNTGNTEPTGKDGWRKLPIDTLNLPAGIVTKLREAGIGSLGDFAAHQEKHGEFWAKQIKGVGKAATDKISDAWEKFWAENRQYT